jgi:hypothetical protein
MIGTIPNPTTRDSDSELLSRIDELLRRLDNIESALRTLPSQRPVKEWYSIAEVAALLGKAEFTVREYARLGRVHATKRKCGRGKFKAWMISHAGGSKTRGYFPLHRSDRRR